MGIFWRGTTGRGAVAGMLLGLAVTVYYMVTHVQGLQGVLPAALRAEALWWGIQPISAGVFVVCLRALPRRFWSTVGLRRCNPS